MSLRVAGALSGIGVALAAFASAALALPGAVSREETAVYRALVENETVVIETRTPSDPPCPDSAPDASCAIGSDVASSFEQANARRGYIDCNQLLLDYKRCVRWRETRRPMFRGFPAVVFSRPGFSADGLTAIVYRTRYSSLEHGEYGWLVLTRATPGEPWRLAREQRPARF